MKIVSINGGSPREIFHGGRRIRTAIFKAPVSARVRVSVLNIAGDEQADLTVHGGASKEAGAPAAQKTLDHVFARENHVSVADITRLYAFDRNDFAGRRGAAELKALPESWRSYFNEHVNKLTACG